MKVKIFGFALLFFSFTLNCYGEEINIIYTGETHSMLYTCSCPIETDGGVARRATLIKELRRKNPNTLFLDSGGSFAGGLLDEYTQNTDLDVNRTVINLKAMELMKYDALNIGDDEFNFGRDFLEESFARIRLPFISSNIVSNKIQPYIIKDIAGVKFGIIGVNSLMAAQKSGGLKLLEPKSAVKKAIENAKNNGADVIILLSHLSESESLSLIQEIPGIDVLILGHILTKEKLEPKIGQTIVVRPSWQGRKLGKLILDIENKKIINFKTEEIRLSDKIKDDTDILAFLPKCFSDANCKRKGLVGICNEPGAERAVCAFAQPAKVNITVILPKSCKVCNTLPAVNMLKQVFTGAVVSYKYYPDSEAKNLVERFGINSLPVYLLGSEITKAKGFDDFAKNLDKKGEFYILKTEVVGVSYFLERKKEPGRLDLFLSLFDPTAKDLLKIIKEYKPIIHFLAVEGKGNFDAAKGLEEVEEYRRSVCVEKYYPKIFWDYISCRAANINSSWWEDCAAKADADKIRACARDKESENLLRENIHLNKEIKVLLGPVYLLNNQEVFSTQGSPTKDELRKILK